MGFEDGDGAFETQLAMAAWLLELADRWNDRDPKFAELLRVKVREIQKTEDEKAKHLSNRLQLSVRTHRKSP